MKFLNKCVGLAAVALVMGGPVSAEEKAALDQSARDPSVGGQPVPGQPVPGQPVKVRFTGIDPEKGTLWISLCTREEVPKIAQGGCRHSAQITAKEGAQHTFTPSAPGTYVISAYHDDNDNGRLDFDEQGVPFEAIGNSRNAVGEFGPPTFDQTKFEVQARSTTPQALSLTIEMRRIELP